MQFIPRLGFIMLSGTESNHGIKFIMWSAIFNPRLPLVGFPGTGASTVDTYPVVSCMAYDFISFNGQWDLWHLPLQGEEIFQTRAKQTLFG